ncbi:SusC/RagA family TonB-linked outer membrane protein [Limibacter armeniacum]|uniref:SusC/RagA family TonB-linked outer membrane protein n=1 Tax=Limibacter armeniacum TaxID=466084 RepID=UPI002FE5A859
MLQKLLLTLCLCAGCVLLAYAQEQTVTGTVSDEQGPLPGVTVQIKGTSKGVVTNIEGKYTISVPSSETVLIYNFVGYTDKEVTVGNQSVIDVLLAQDTQELEEVVVTAIGVERSERSLGYAVQAVNSEDLLKTNETSALNSLQGKVAGVNISSASGNPGASTKVRIRGLSSISGDNQPLYVINGVPVSNSAIGSSDLNGSLDFGNALNDLNPEDIQEVSVLKGAAATTLYGSRGANGVILITTKSGQDAATRRKKAEISVNFGVSFLTPLKLPEFQNRYGQGIDGDTDLEENTSWGPRFDGQLRPWGRVVDNQQKIKPYENLEDNVRNFFDVGVTYNTGVSLGGGNEKTNYYLSYSNVTSDGYIPTSVDEYNRNTISFSGGTDLFNGLKSTININYINTESSQVYGGQQQNSIFNSLYQIPRDIPITELADLNAPFNTPENYFTPFSLLNPYFVINEYGNEYNADRVFGSLDLSYELVKNLNLRWRIGTDVINRELNEWEPVLDIEGPNASQSNPGRFRVTRQYNNVINSDVILTYLLKFTEDFSMNALVGYQVNPRKSRTLVTEVGSLQIPGFYDISNSADRPTSIQNDSERRYNGVYAQVDFDFRNWLFLTLTARNDWSSTLPKDERSFFYPSASLGVVFSDVLDTGDWLSYGKLRLSAAQAGNDAPPYSTQTVFKTSGFSDGFTELRFPLNNAAAFSEDNLAGNPSLKPELTTEYEAGLEMRFYNGRFGFDFTYYDRTIEDLIFTVPQSPSSGFSSQTRNIGKISNKGIEVLLTATPVETPSFTWDISVNFTRNRNNVEELADGLEEVPLGGLSTVPFVAIEGRPLGVIKGQVPRRDPNGNIIVNSDGRPDYITDQEIGDTQVDFITGMTNTFSWKWLSFDFTVDWRKGGLMYSRTADLLYFLGTTPYTTYNDRRPFVIPNSVVEVSEGEFRENTTPIAQEGFNMLTFWGDGGFEGDRAFLVKRDYIKLREVNFTLTAPKQWLKNTPFGRASISFVGRNMFIWTPDSNIFVDPESSSFVTGSGTNDIEAEYGEFSTTLPTRSYGFAIKFTL